MAELTSTKLNAESHLLLDQPLVRMPYELSRRNFKNAQRVIEHHSSTLTTALAGASKTPDPTAALDSIISKMQGLKRKLEVLHDEELRIHKAARARLSHLQSLYSIPSLTSVQYDEWSRTRLSRLLVDYLLRSGFSSSAAHLASSKGITDLVDVEPFVACHKIEKSLRGGRSTAAALEWCKEHGKELKKMGGRLEFELRLQQYIELVREGHELGMAGADDEGVRIGNGGGEKKLVEAMSHAKKWLAGSGDAELLQRAAGLLAFRPWEGVEPYATLYSPTRWTHLSSLFLSTHHTLYSLPPRPLLHIALSAGLSALKTPACHSLITKSMTPSTNPSIHTTPLPATSDSPVCPICSTELNELARNVPYAHHTKSIVPPDAVVLPNGRVHGRDRLKGFNKQVGTEEGWVRDPTEGLVGETWRESEVRKVYIL